MRRVSTGGIEASAVAGESASCPTLFVTDAELIRRLGVPEKAARVAIRELERRPGFPRKDALFGNRRFWPAVFAYLAKRYGLGTLAPSPPDGSENFDALDRPTGKARRA
jgi:hypothetical protein